MALPGRTIELDKESSGLDEGDMMRDLRLNDHVISNRYMLLAAIRGIEPEKNFCLPERE